MSRTLAIAALAFAACLPGTTHDGLDASDATFAHDGADAAALDSRPDAHDATIPDGACVMVSPPARCGDGVCDPGCEARSPADCPADCPAPDGGIPCDGGPSKWTCNANGSAIVECFHGVLHIQICGPPGSCRTVAGNYPDQCHSCVPCTGWNSASPAHGQPYVYNCSTSQVDQRQRCVDVRIGGDCIQGSSNTADCCIVTDTCLGGACIVQPVGVDDRCP